jgi:malate dehydrogenase (quinone)
MLGASPGASTAVWIMLQVIERCFAEKLKDGGWSGKLKELIPSTVNLFPKIRPFAGG